jgi:hypothetical protein
MDHGNRIVLTFEAPGSKFVDVLWGLKGDTPKQFTAVTAPSSKFAATFYFEPTQPGETYSFKAQGCINAFSSPSNCSEWSENTDVTAIDNLHSVVKFFEEEFYGQALHQLKGSAILR